MGPARILVALSALLVLVFLVAPQNVQGATNSKTGTLSVSKSRNPTISPTNTRAPSQSRTVAPSVTGTTSVTKAPTTSPSNSKGPTPAPTTSKSPSFSKASKPSAAAITPSTTYTGLKNAFTAAPACTYLPAGAYFWQENWSSVLATVLKIIPEGVKVNPNLLSTAGNWDPNLHFNLDTLGAADHATVRVTFVYVNAGFKNQLGYFLFTDDKKIIPGSETLLFRNVDTKTNQGGCLVAGDSVTIGPFLSGTNVGFFIKANGFNVGASAPTYYTIKALNKDGHDHVVMMEDSITGQYLMSFEDSSLGDADYNDLVFTVLPDPKSAVKADIPVTKTCNNFGCNGNGVCDLVSGRCTCNVAKAISFTGVLCDVPVTCKPSCKNGFCSDQGFCTCTPPWTGAACSEQQLLPVPQDTSISCESRISSNKACTSEKCDINTGTVATYFDGDSSLVVQVDALSGYQVVSSSIFISTSAVPLTLEGAVDIDAFTNIYEFEATSSFTKALNVRKIGSVCGNYLNVAIYTMMMNTETGELLDSYADGENGLGLGQGNYFKYKVCCTEAIPVPQSVVPSVECVSPNEDGTWTARFNYLNNNPAPVNIQVGSGVNFVAPGELDRGQPWVFLEGFVKEAFLIVLDDCCRSGATWSILGPDGVTRSATANRNSTVCTVPPPQAPPVFDPPNAPIRPTLYCTSENEDGSFTSRWGYTSSNVATVLYPVGPNNFFSDMPDMGQTVIFRPGQVVNDFFITWDGSEITWTLIGPDGITRTATADKVTKLCGDELILDPVNTLPLPHPPCAPVTPSVCVNANDDGTYTARFSYFSANTFIAGLAIGNDNFFSPGGADRGQIQLFVPGRQDNVFFTVFAASEELTWTLKTPYVPEAMTLTFNANTTPCKLDLPTPTNLVAQINPIVECVTFNDDQTFSVRFGYDNLFVSNRAKQLETDVPLLAIKALSDNFVSPSDLPQTQTTFFRPGRQTSTFFVLSPSLPVSWSIKGLDGVIREATADLDSPPCAAGPKFAADITPILDCIVHNEDGTYTARFGYNNENNNGIATINIGANNVITPAALNGKQINKFGPGLHSLTFFVVFQEDQLPGSWKLTSPNGKTTEITITNNGPQQCPVL